MKLLFFDPQQRKILSNLRCRLLPVLSAVLALLPAGCASSVPDYRPFGTGMEAIGVCLVCCSVVSGLADLIKGHPPTPPPLPPKNHSTPKE